MEEKKRKAKWLALFSQTGSEICCISEALSRWPDKILTDNTNSDKIDKRILSRDKDVCVDRYRSYKSKEDKINYHNFHFEGYDIITLHGWLNIVPAEICEKYNIYNGHPGLVNLYPELVGKDPQVRTWENIKKYNYIGSIIHKVTNVVDGGEIVCTTKTSTDGCTTLDKTFNVLKFTSQTSWLIFLRDIL
jgi:folate-dependent phosphoribosylglycinamide formyltransferase PurN